VCLGGCCECFLQCRDDLVGRAVATHKENLNAPIPDAAREAVLRAGNLAAHDRAEEAVEGLRRAIALGPNFYNAHVKYIGIRKNFMEQMMTRHAPSHGGTRCCHILDISSIH
jgi:hypothetical protein